MEMKQRYDERHEGDNTPSVEIAIEYRKAIHNDEHDVNLSLIHYRGGEVEYLLGKEYCASEDPDDRATGADILAQLGWSDQTYRDESINILIPLLEDQDNYVIYCAAVALGHRAADSAIINLIRHVDNPDPLIRNGVVFGLLSHEDDEAISALLKLAKDDDRDVRNWAVFGLGTQIDFDSPSIREALREALGDVDYEVRGEGLVGLAKRGDPAVVIELFNEWRDDDVSILSLEAAEEIGDPRLFQRLNEFTQILTIEDDTYFANQLADAITACTPK